MPDGEYDERWDCDLDGEEVEQDGRDRSVKVEVVKGKKVNVYFAKCDHCDEYFSHATSDEDLAANVEDGSVLIGDDGKYLASRLRIVEVEPEDPRDDEDMGRYRHDDYDY
jgi:hypothetical protein